MNSSNMLNQVSLEALYSATYVENYLDCVENLPDDLQRHMTRMRELDVSYRACLRDVENHLELCVNICMNESTDNSMLGSRKARAVARVQQALIAAQELGDEKLQVVQQLQDLIDLKSRQLDHDSRKLLSCLESSTNGTPKEETAVTETIVAKETNTVAIGNPPATQTAASATPPHNPEREKDKNDRDKSAGERSSKRARRTRTDTQSGGDSGSADRENIEASTHRTNNSSSSNNKVKAGTGKKKKRKSRQAAAQSQREETPPPEEPDPIDPDEPTYCLCDQISFGEMILCDNDLCPIEWFHFSCVSLNTKPKGKWFCPKCRGDRPNVMKPKGQFLKELERYNKEKEEKA